MDRHFVNRHRHLLLASAVTALVAFSGLVGAAQRPGPGGPAGPGGPGFGLRAEQLPLRQLNLTDAQKEQVRQLMDQHREQSRGLFGRVQAAQEAQRKAMEAIPFSEPQIRSAMQALGEVQTELAVQQARLQSDVFALLTPDQQEQLKKIRADRQARMKNRQDRLQQRRPRPQA